MTQFLQRMKIHFSVSSTTFSQISRWIVDECLYYDIIVDSVSVIIL